ncbi:MAG: amidohydrolase family protein [bacterium]|nr:amidohydrolase family protein [bacterium]
MIDIHMHIGKLYFDKPLEPAQLLDFMDKNGIEKAVLLPIENPEATVYYVTTEYVLDICEKYPDKFIPFCNVDPRRVQVDRIIKEYKERGCKGFGELLAGLYVDDLRMQKIYKTCGELGLPIIFDLYSITCLDDIGLPRYENMIKRFPKTIFIGHGPHFWAEISSDFDLIKISYPKGKVKSPGAVERILSKYPNAYADISAGSGFNALTRDPEFGYRFLEEFQDKLFFGSDICNINQIDKVNENSFYLNNALKEGKISKLAYKKIAEGNTKRILKL